MGKRKADIIAGIACVLVASIFWTQTIGLDPESKIFPQILEIFMIIMGFFVMGRGLLQKNESADEQEPEKLDWVKSVVIVIASIVYVLGMTYIGYYVTTAVYLTLGSMYLNDENHSWSKKIGGSMAFGIGVTIVLYLTFYVFLKVPTPSSLLF